MPKYQCRCCNYQTHIKCNYDKHVISLKHQTTFDHKHSLPYKQSFDEELHQSYDDKLSFDDETSYNELTTVSSYICKYCHKEFKHRSGLSRHIKYSCKHNDDEDLKELVRLLNKQLDDKDSEMKCQISNMQKQIDRLTSKLQIQQINNHHSNNNNQNYNIKILNYNNTDYSHLTDEDYVKCIKDCNKCVRTIIEKVHFNKKKPENMNVYISSIKGNYVMMYKDNQWQIVNRKETIDTMFDKNEFELESWYDEYKDKYPEIITSFERYIKNKDDYDDTINDVKEDIMLMLYNKRRMLGVA